MRESKLFHVGSLAPLTHPGLERWSLLTAHPPSVHEKGAHRMERPGPVLKIPSPL